jgi:hypothetical protein
VKKETRKPRRLFDYCFRAPMLRRPIVARHAVGLLVGYELLHECPALGADVLCHDKREGKSVLFFPKDMVMLAKTNDVPQVAIRYGVSPAVEVICL